MKRKKKTQRQLLIRQNDDLARQIALLRDDATCQRTYRKANIQVCHVFSRSNLRLRWELDNLVCLNAGVHLYWAHKEPLEFFEWIEERLGKHRFEVLKLKKRYHSPVRMDEILGWNLLLKNTLKEAQCELK